MRRARSAVAQLLPPPARSIGALSLALALLAAPGSALQFGGSWALQPGWQLVQDHRGNPDLLVIGLYGEPPFDPRRSPSPPSRQARERTDRLIASSGRMPRLALRCEEGVTSLIVLRPAAAAVVAGPPSLPNRRAQPTASSGVAEKLALQLDGEDPLEIELPTYVRPIDPVYLPDPFDNIGRLRRHQMLYYFELNAGEPMSFDYSRAGLGASVDAVLPLEGLDDLLRATRDPCGWRSS